MLDPSQEQNLTQLKARPTKKVSLFPLGLLAYETLTLHCGPHCNVHFGAQHYNELSHATLSGPIFLL